MGNGVFTIAEGRQAHYATLPAASDSMIAVVLRGAEADDLLRTRETLAQVLANNTEANFTGYARRTLAGVTVTVDHSAGTPIVRFDANLTAWDPAGGATNNTTAKLIACYVPTSGAADSAIIPVWHWDFVRTTDGVNPLGWSVAETGVWRAQPA